MGAYLRLVATSVALSVTVLIVGLGIAVASTGSSKTPPTNRVAGGHSRSRHTPLMTHLRKRHHSHQNGRRVARRRPTPRSVTSHKAAGDASKAPLLAPDATVIVGAQPQPAGAPAPAPPVEAPSLREASSTAYEGLSPQAAEATVQEKYPALIDGAAGGPPPVAEGQKATGFPNDFAMSVDLGGGSHALVESSTPIALETEDGKHEPLDLSLHETNGGFEPTFGLAPVRIPPHVSEGVTLADSDVSLTPVSELGSPLGGAPGVPNYASVFYGDTENVSTGAQDLSLLAKPTTYGFEMFSTLFSARSPEHLFFKVGLPEGATLEMARSEEVSVSRGGQPIAAVSAFSARDAEGTNVPISMSIASSNTIELTITRRRGQFRYPLVVDPLVEDKTLLPYLNPAWVVAPPTHPNFSVSEFPESILMIPTKAYPGGEYIAYQYETQGKSKIYQFEATTAERDSLSETDSLLEAWAPSGTRQNWGLVANNNNHASETKVICAIETTTCLPSQGAEKRDRVDIARRRTDSNI
jgi:hypothetical protein